MSSTCSCRPKGIADGSEVEVLSGELLQAEKVQSAWSPFTQPLESAGLPRKTFRAPVLKKLSAAGFTNVLDVCFI